jgi:DNA primase
VEEYHSPNPGKTPNTRKYRGISYTTPINAAKEAVPVIDLADLLLGPGRMRRVGEKWVARCPLPDHEERTPSFTVYAGDGGWYCYGCLRGGDVVELYRLYHDYDQREAHTAAAMLLMEFGRNPPERPPSWFAKQERQKAARDALKRTKRDLYRRRLFKHLILPDIDAIKDQEERNQELERAWADFQKYLP